MENQKEMLYWIELCGFDRTHADYGVSETLGKIPQRVDGFVLLFANLEFYHEFVLDGDETLLSINDCAYGGKKRYGDRVDMRWTKGQLKGLISALHKAGKKVFATVFDGIEFPTENPFANENQTVFQLSSDGSGSPVCDLTADLADGTPYASFLGGKIRETLGYYGFDGVHLADGICSWRLPLQIGNYAPDRLLAFAESIEDGKKAGKIRRIANENAAIGKTYRKRSEKIWNGFREEWIEFCSKRWAERFGLLVAELPEKTIIVMNAAWTRDPFEAKYRYGFDLTRVDFSRISAYIFNDVNRKITPKEDNCGFYIAAEEYKYYENEAPATTLVTKGALDSLYGGNARNGKGGKPFYSLVPIRDNNEKWDVLRSCKQSFTAKVYRKNNSFSFDGEYARTGAGNLYCLSTGVEGAEWEFIAKVERDACLPIEKPLGFCFLFSQNAQNAETSRYVRMREWSAFRWLKETQTAGLPVYTVASFRSLDKAEMPLVCFNVDAFSNEEKAKLEIYRKQPLVVFAEENPLNRTPDQILQGGDVCCFIFNAEKIQTQSIGEKLSKNSRKRQKEAAAGIWIKNLGYKKRERMQTVRAVKILNERFGFVSATRGVMVNAVKDGETVRLILDNPNSFGVTTRLTGKLLKNATGIELLYGDFQTAKNGVNVFVEGHGVNVVTVKTAGDGSRSR